MKMTFGLIHLQNPRNVLIQEIELREQNLDQARLNNFGDAHRRNYLRVLKLGLQNVEQQSQTLREHEVCIFFVRVFEGEFYDY